MLRSRCRRSRARALTSPENAPGRNPNPRHAVQETPCAGVVEELGAGTKYGVGDLRDRPRRRAKLGPLVAFERAPRAEARAKGVEIAWRTRRRRRVLLVVA